MASETSPDEHHLLEFHRTVDLDLDLNTTLPPIDEDGEMGIKPAVSSTPISSPDIDSAPQRRGTSVTELEPHDVYQLMNCPSHEPVIERCCSWFFATVIVLSTYTTLLSGLFLIIACLKPYYGNLVGDTGGLAPSSATLLSAFFAKTIELSYVTVSVAFVGQLLSRRALRRGSQGISISDMSLRMWITQPGSLFMQWETLRYSGGTLLGIIALIATLVSMLYTTAAEALVSPKSAMGPVYERLLYGNVSTQFANPTYLEAQCDTPITATIDPSASRNETCVSMEIVGRAYHDFEQYMEQWSGLAQANNATSTSLTTRLRPHGSLYDNTTVTGSWIEVTDMKATSERFKRMVNNVTAAFPHGGLYDAARNPRNGIRQPNDVTGDGKYILQASVPAPAINVLCAGLSKEELVPMIYTEWPNHEPFNATSWYTKAPTYYQNTNKTVVDEVFGFGPGTDQLTPVFPIYPTEFNTIFNAKVENSSALYLLGTTPVGHNPAYVLCALKAKQSGLCSAQYQVDSSGAELSTRCEDPKDELQYSRRVPDVSEDYYEINWKSVGWLWLDAVSLGSGIAGEDASIERLLMQMVPAYDNSSNTASLNANLPSIAEAMAVLTSVTLMISSQDAPYVPFWNYSAPILSPPVQQVFNATLQSSGYASGNAVAWQKSFYVVLVLAFLTSVLFMAFFMVEVRGRLLNDFTEPSSMFSLAINSPPTARLQGACGGGPSGRQLQDRWHVGMVEDSHHYYIRPIADGEFVPPDPGSDDETGKGGGAHLAVHEYRSVSRGAASPMSFLY
ncbi:uncharacterized protein BO97DRAFT_403122 [Aspergillus homomorphus CBS 101889]|uniref:Uncharacterized protein n=1 Tax=Aspergillus homomorphus (strain CBS 101889) TaxID=1450537 RepID=A0A395I6U6_ASPHC|nr:hypothetical protein BO97DRAFT_403122 [Aspergillus homomorphus CBS 101889]RAL15911.1 hypothetical protein BO97DRAFT_403122 [Aspergillus homomorphus CBS 101889]